MSDDYDLPDEVPESNFYPPCPPKPVFCSTLSRRDHFAMAAMQGLLATPGDWSLQNGETSEGVCAVMSVRYADALIAELDGGTE